MHPCSLLLLLLLLFTCRITVVAALPRTLPLLLVVLLQRCLQHLLQRHDSPVGEVPHLWGRGIRPLLCCILCRERQQAVAVCCSFQERRKRYKCPRRRYIPASCTA
jgi:hypothetical protein